MDTTTSALEILRELESLMRGVNADEGERLADEVLRAGRVFVWGAGRSGLAGRAFAMRLVHLGLNAYICGETTAPAMQKDDLLVCVSGSGETQTLAVMARKAAALHARIALVTTRAESTLGAMADTVLVLRAPNAKADFDKSITSVQPMGSLFEQACLLYLDAVVMRLMERTGQTGAQMHTRHANLE